MDKVRFSKSKTGGHNDPRREIIDVVLPEGYKIPFPVRQIKLIMFNENPDPVGQHYHPAKKEPAGEERWELFIVRGPEGSSGRLIRARFRKVGEEEIYEVFMEDGETCLVPPGNAHSFKILQPGVQLFGLSNLPQKNIHDVKDPLF